MEIVRRVVYLVSLSAIFSCLSQAQTSTPAPPPAVQSTDGTYTLRSTAQLVVVDAVVTDKQGHVVTGLIRENFHLTELGEPQTIRDFEPAGTHGLAPDITINSTADLDRLAPKAALNIIVLDEFNTRIQDLAFAQYSLKEYWKHQPDKLPIPTMLVAVNLLQFTVLRDYTQSKQELQDALKRHVSMNDYRASSGSWAGARYSQAFRTLMRVAEASEGHVGHKNMIWVGRGFPPLQLDKASVDTQERIESIVQDTVNLLRDARVTLYTVDPAGISAYPPPGGTAFAIDDPFGGNYQFAKLAKATGGIALYGRNDVDAEIGTSIQDGASFYSLSYKPVSTTDDPKKFRRIKLSVDRPGLTVTTREGYYVQRPVRREDPVTPSKQLASDLLMAAGSTMVYDAVPVSIAVAGTDPTAAMIHVDASALTWTDAVESEPRRTDIVLMVCWFDRKGKEVKRDARNLRFKAPAEVAPTGRLDRPLNIPYKLDTVSNAVRARVVVRVGSSGKIGTADLALHPGA